MALLDGVVVAVACDLDRAVRILRMVEPDPQRGLLVEVRKPVVDAIR